MAFRYVKKESIIHRINPVSKLLILFAITVVSFITEDLIFLTAILFVPCAMLLLAKSPRALIPNPLMLVTVIIIAWFMRGWEGAGLITIRIMALFYSAEMFSITTGPKEFASALERVGMPFQMVFVISTALRIIPILEDELWKIRDAQVSRGLDLETRNPVKRMRNSIPLLVPLLRGSIRRAHEMALALESRGFRSAQFVRH